MVWIVCAWAGRVNLIYYNSFWALCIHMWQHCTGRWEGGVAIKQFMYPHGRLQEIPASSACATQAAETWSKVVFKVVLTLVFNYMCRWMTWGRLGLLFSASLATIYMVSVQSSGEVCSKGWTLLSSCSACSLDLSGCWARASIHSDRQRELDL